MAQERAASTRERVERRRFNLAQISMILSTALVVGYLIVWASTVQGSGGPEGYVRNTDFIATLTGGLIIRQGDGVHLYDRETQRIAQDTVLRPYKVLTDNNILPYNHPAVRGAAGRPLMGLRYWFAFAAWTLVAGLAVGVSVGLLDSALPVSRQTGWALSLAACSYLPLLRS